MKTWLYVDRDALGAKRAPIIIRREGEKHESHAWEVRLPAGAVLKFQQCGPTPAKVFVEVDGDVEVTRPE